MDDVVMTFLEQPIEPPDQQRVYICPDKHPFDLDAPCLKLSDVIIQGLVPFHKKDKGGLIFGLVQARQ